MGLQDGSLAAASDIDWMACEMIERVPGKVSGRPIVRGTRIMPDPIVNNLSMAGRRLAIVSLSSNEAGRMRR